jgi:hypothetical protein
MKIPQITARSSRGVNHSGGNIGNITLCKTNSLVHKALTRPAGLEPATYGLEICRPENLTSLKLNSYLTPKNQSTVNSTENSAKIREDLTKIINRWPSLLPNIQAAIMVLIGDNEYGA